MVSVVIMFAMPGEAAQKRERIIMAVTVDTDLCVGCGACASECPCDALTVDEVAEVDADACVECGLCVDTCPCEALSL